MIFLIILAVLTGTTAAVLNHPSFGRAPRGERLERIGRSPNYRDGKFHNIHPTPITTAEKGGLSGIWHFLFGKRRDLKPENDLPTVKTDLHGLDRNEETVVWFGHSSYFIQSGGKRFLVDPVLTNRPPMSLMFRPFKGTDVYTPDDIPDVDFLIVTHEHWDHLDYNTVKRLKNRVGKVVCPLGVGEHFEYWGFPPERIAEMDWYDTLYADDRLAIHCLPARHYSNRILKRDRTLWASFMIDGPQRIYLSGDGGYDTHFAEIGEKFPGIDLAVMENGQYDRDWRYIHLMPDELVRAIDDLKPRTVLTVHNSKYALCKHPWHEPLDNIRKASAGRPYRLLTPRIGEKTSLRDTVATSGKWWYGRSEPGIRFRSGPRSFRKDRGPLYPSCSIYKVCRNAERKIPPGFRNRSAQPHPRNILPGAFLS